MEMGQTRNKQAVIEISLESLMNAINQLESLADQVIGNPSSLIKSDQPKLAISLSDFLTQLPEVLDRDGKRIMENIERLRSNLY